MSAPAIEGVTSPDVKPSTKKRKPKRRKRDLVQKADRSAWRAFWFLLFPVLPAGLSYYYFLEDNLRGVLIYAGIAVASALLFSPLVLAWSIAALRRGTRWLPLPIITGFIAAFELVAMLVLIAGGIVGYMVVMGEPVPWLADQQWAEPLNSFDFHDFLLGQPSTGVQPEIPFDLNFG